jgi:DNA-binding PadR family transcriptional regulator
MSQVKLYYLTTNGCEWLEEVVEVSEDNFVDVLREYIIVNHSTARKLVEKWRANGEDIDMFCEVENIDTPTELFSSIYETLEDMTCYEVLSEE